MKVRSAILYFTAVFFVQTTYCQKYNDLEASDIPEFVRTAKRDTDKVKMLLVFADYYYFLKPDSSLLLALNALELAGELGFTKGELKALNSAGESLRFMGEYPRALEMQSKALEMYQKNGDKEREAATLGFIGFIYMELREFREALNYLFQAKTIFDNTKNIRYGYLGLSNIGNSYEELNMLDSALYFQQMAYSKIKETKIENLKALVLTRLGNLFARLGKFQEALQSYSDAEAIVLKINDKVNLSKIHYRVAELYLKQNKKDSALYYARSSLANSTKAFQRLQILETAELLASLFRMSDSPDSVIYYQDLSIAMNDSLFGAKKYRELQLLALKEQKKEQEYFQKQERAANNTRTTILMILLFSFLAIGIILFRNIRNKQKINAVLNSQKQEIQNSLAELESTQAQLIQREKMASLGELTAGIAHEIQNPLNFVNNFSDLNKELLLELKDEVKKKNYNDVEMLAENIISNEEKINHHGKRAEAIVKNMLQHSRTNSEKKELTDINELANEYLRLSYHGLRAKDKSFEANFETEFDPLVGKINIITQDIGRVMLNLFNNAFYAVAEKRKANGNNYEPMVTVITRKKLNSIEIEVEDNGAGIPQPVLNKIFQPFFTTKPAGQGTGLGLSLSYDIVKAHGGELNVETKENEGTKFIINLPV